MRRFATRGVRHSIARAMTPVIAAAAACLIAHAPLTAQGGPSQRDGFHVHFQLGSAWSALRDVAPPLEGQTFTSRTGAVTAVRVSRRVVGPLSGFIEGGSASRGSKIQAPGFSDTEFRTRWFDGALGVNLASRCVGEVCPSIDVGGVLGYSREALLLDASSGRPSTRVSTARYETSALVGVRLRVPRLRDVSALVRWQQGLTDLISDETTAKSRAFVLQLAVPIY